MIGKVRRNKHSAGRGLTSIGPLFLWSLTNLVKSAYLGNDMIERRVIFLQRFSRVITRAKVEHGINLLIFWFHRTDDQQKALYAIGRTIELHRGPVTNCDGVIKKSRHQKWEAVDVVIVKDGALVWSRIPEYEIIGYIGKEEGLRWGGDWDGDAERDPNDFDIYHFEYRGS